MNGAAVGFIPSLSFLSVDIIRVFLCSRGQKKVKSMVGCVQLELRDRDRILRKSGEQLRNEPKQTKLVYL